LKDATAWLNSRLHYEFSSPELLTQALTHRSVQGGNNERLEFLGDAVLDTVISELVFRRLPRASEGELSRLRSALVKDSTLATLARQLEVGKYLILGPGEKKAGGHRRGSILADALEAIFGAVYLDAGYAAAERVIIEAFGERLEDLPDAADLRDPKTRLQELLQARKIELPAYEVTDISGEAHRQTFGVTCTVPAVGLQSQGSGASRRDAEQAAAGSMLDQLERLDSLNKQRPKRKAHDTGR
jgi:ribonuclease-3